MLATLGFVMAAMSDHVKLRFAAAAKAGGAWGHRWLPPEGEARPAQPGYWTQSPWHGADRQGGAPVPDCRVASVPQRCAPTAAVVRKGVKP